MKVFYGRQSFREPVVRRTRRNSFTIKTGTIKKIKARLIFERGLLFTHKLWVELLK